MLKFARSSRKSARNNGARDHSSHEKTTHKSVPAPQTSTSKVDTVHNPEKHRLHRTSSGYGSASGDSETCGSVVAGHHVSEVAVSRNAVKDVTTQRVAQLSLGQADTKQTAHPELNATEEVLEGGDSCTHLDTVFANHLDSTATEQLPGFRRKEKRLLSHRLPANRIAQESPHVPENKSHKSYFKKTWSSVTLSRDVDVNRSLVTDKVMSGSQTFTRGRGIKRMESSPDYSRLHQVFLPRDKNDTSSAVMRSAYCLQTRDLDTLPDLDRKKIRRFVLNLDSKRHPEEKGGNLGNSTCIPEERLEITDDVFV